MIANKSTQMPEMKNSEELELSVSLMHQGQIYARNAWQISCYGMYIARILRQSMARIYKR